MQGNNHLLTIPFTIFTHKMLVISTIILILASYGNADSDNEAYRNTLEMADLRLNNIDQHTMCGEFEKDILRQPWTKIKYVVKLLEQKVDVLPSLISAEITEPDNLKGSLYVSIFWLDTKLVIPKMELVDRDGDVIAAISTDPADHWPEIEIMEKMVTNAIRHIGPWLIKPGEKSPNRFASVTLDPTTIEKIAAVVMHTEGRIQYVPVINRLKLKYASRLITEKTDDDQGPKYNTDNSSESILNKGGTGSPLDFIPLDFIEEQRRKANDKQ